MPKRIDTLVERIDELGIDGILKRLTAREVRWIDAYLGKANFNATSAERIAGSATGGNHKTYSATRWAGCHTYKRLEPVILKLVEASGFSELSVKARLVRKLDAKKTEFFAHLGKVVETKRVDDHSTQMKALELIGKAKGMFNDKVAEHIDRLIEFELARIAAARESEVPPRAA
jgi:hypothetical protein